MSVIWNLSDWGNCLIHHSIDHRIKLRWGIWVVTTTRDPTYSMVHRTFCVQDTRLNPPKWHTQLNWVHLLLKMKLSEDRYDRILPLYPKRRPSYVIEYYLSGSNKHDTFRFSGSQLNFSSHKRFFRQINTEHNHLWVEMHSYHLSPIIPGQSFRSYFQVASILQVNTQRLN